MPRPDPRPWPHGRKYIGEDGRKQTVSAVKRRTRHVCPCGRTWDLFTDEGRDAPTIDACPVCGQAVTPELEV